MHYSWQSVQNCAAVVVPQASWDATTCPFNHSIIVGSLVFVPCRM